MKLSGYTLVREHNAIMRACEPQDDTYSALRKTAAHHTERTTNDNYGRHHQQSPLSP